MSANPVGPPNVYFPQQLTPTSLEDTILIEETSYAPPSLPPTQQSESPVMKVWEHFFHFMPLNDDKSAWDRFSFDQIRLEIRLSLQRAQLLVREETLQPERVTISSPVKCHAEGAKTTYTKKWDPRKHLTLYHSNRTDRIINLKDKQVLNVKPFPCPLENCNSGFARKRDLSLHLRRKHSKY